MSLPRFRHAPRLIRAVLALGFFAAVFPARSAPREFNFDEMFSHPDLWKMSQAEFQKHNQSLPFTWTSQSQESARAAWPGMKLFGLPVVEVIARFQDNRLNRITVNYYTRGDVGEVPREMFDRIIDLTKGAITNYTKVQARDRGKDPTNAVSAIGHFWDTDKARFLLEYSFRPESKVRYTKFRAEFVRLEISPPVTGGAKLASGALATTTKPRFSGLRNVERVRANGDVFLKDIPMVDQGDKGYCVVASTERVLRYYGSDVDSNELAQVTDASRRDGTSLHGMRFAMRKLSTRLKIRFREIERIEVRDVIALIKDYNRFAKTAGEPEVPLPGGVVDLGKIYESMNPRLFKEARLRRTQEFSRFQQEIRNNIEQGIPLLWSVQLGIIQEAEIPQDAGGHMRLIIGYNSKMGEIIFSDSWGAGHERKRMSIEDAWAITTGLMKIEPQS